MYADRVEPWLWDRHEEILAAMDLQAPVQRKNLRTVLTALDILLRSGSVNGGSSPVIRRLAMPVIRRLDRRIYVEERIVYGIEHTVSLMHFHGRWERLHDKPLVIADIGHNAHALASNFKALEAMNRPLIIVYGIMADKDLDAIIPLMPKEARYIFVAPDTPRARGAEDILGRFEEIRRSSRRMTGEGGKRMTNRGGGNGACTARSVRAGMEMAMREANDDTVIYVGGSTFVVAEVLERFAGQAGE